MRSRRPSLTSQANGRSIRRRRLLRRQAVVAGAAVVVVVGADAAVGGLGQEFTAKQDASSLTISRDQGGQPVTATYKLDGSESKNTVPGRNGAQEQVSKTMWMGNKLMITTTVNVGGNNVEQSRTLSLDGGNLVIEQSQPGRDGGAPQTQKARLQEQWNLNRDPDGDRSHTVRVPLQSELGRRSHVAEERGRGDDGRAGQIAFPADTHPVLPVAIERRDRALTGLQRVRSLAEARAAPRLRGSRRRPTGTPRRSTRRRAAHPAARSAGPRRRCQETRRTAAPPASPRAAARGKSPAPPAADRRSCRWCTSRSAPCRTAMRSRATSSAGKRVAGAERLGDHRTARRRATAPRRSRSARRRQARSADTEDSVTPLAAYHARVTASAAKMPFSASASAIMFAMVLR